MSRDFGNNYYNLKAGNAKSLNRSLAVALSSQSGCKDNLLQLVSIGLSQPDKQKLVNPGSVNWGGWELNSDGPK
jgi:hypothetical protein